MLTAGLCLSAGYLSAQTQSPAKGKAVQQKKPAATQSTHAKKPTTQGTHSRPSATHAATGKTTRASAKRRRPPTSRQRLARLHLAPERVEEIQRALAQAGYLEGEPGGQWDTRTREAMRRFQVDHGFPATGLPEAKSLMKLGLGPHPLPADLDSSASARASVDSTTGDPARADPPAGAPGSASPPQQ